MLYKLENATINDVGLVTKYKLNSIFDYAQDLSKEEITRINNYVNSNIPKQINDYKIIRVDNKIIGCLLVLKYLDGVILDEIFIEKEYRGKKIGSKIINDVLRNNDIVYLWVYKSNINAIKLYKNLGFYIIEDNESRYFMKYSKFINMEKN